jgi:hypothetical protein
MRRVFLGLLLLCSCVLGVSAQVQDVENAVLENENLPEEPNVQGGFLEQSLEKSSPDILADVPFDESAPTKEGDPPSKFLI